jgi:hypothetical protein
MSQQFISNSELKKMERILIKPFYLFHILTVSENYGLKDSNFKTQRQYPLPLAHSNALH